MSLRAIARVRARTIGRSDDYRIDPDLREGFRFPQNRVRRGIFCDPGQGRHLDRLGIPANVGAVAMQHINLVFDHCGITDDVARIGILRDEPEGLALPSSSD